MPKRTFSVPAAIVDMSADLSSSPAASGNGAKKANGSKKVDQPEKEVEKKVDRSSYIIPAAKGKGFANPAVIEDVIRQLLPPFLSRGKK